MQCTEVCFLSPMCFYKTSPSDSRSTWLQGGSCSIYRINSKHKAKQKDVWGKFPDVWQAAGLHDTSSDVKEWLQESVLVMCYNCGLSWKPYSVYSHNINLLIVQIVKPTHWDNCQGKRQPLCKTGIFRTIILVFMTLPEAPHKHS